MPPVLYMTPLSPPSRAVLMTAEAIGLQLKLQDLDISKGENRKPEYAKLNPLHTVPTLVDGDVIITDSHAINAYLIRKYAKSDELYPEDYGKRAMVDQMLFFDAEKMFSVARNALWDGCARSGIMDLAHLLTSDFKREVMRNFFIIRSILDRHTENFNILLGNKITKPLDISMDQDVHNLMEKLPLSSNEDLEDLENRLNNANYFKAFAKQLGMLGGEQLERVVKKIMYSTISNRMGKEFSHDGAKGKRPFKKLRLYKVIMEAVRLNKICKDETDDRIIKEMKKWLVRARERFENEQKKQ